MRDLAHRPKTEENQNTFANQFKRAEIINKRRFAKKKKRETHLEYWFDLGKGGRPSVPERKTCGGGRPIQRPRNEEVLPMLAAKLCGSYDSYKSTKVFAWRRTQHDDGNGQTKIRLSLFGGGIGGGSHHDETAASFRSTHLAPKSTSHADCSLFDTRYQGI